jgi:phage-related protein
VPRRRKRPRSEPKRRWRDSETPAGRRPVRDFLAGLDDDDAAAVLAAMKDVEKNGLAVAERLDDELHEVKADGTRQTFRVLFAPEGKHDQVLLSLEAFSKKTQKTPPAKIRLARRRLQEWRARGR